jgi:hypothetical protein
MKNPLGALLLATALMGITLSVSPPAEAGHCWWDYHGRKHCDRGLHKGWHKNKRIYPDDTPLVADYKTRQIVKGGLIGAGIGAGTAVVLDKPVAKTAVVGAGIGSGVQAVRYSRYMHEHPVVRTTTYGALAGAGVSQVSRETSLGEGILWGSAIGAGAGVLRDAR